MKITKLLRIFFAIDVGVVLFCYLEHNYVWFLNTQFAIFSAILIIFGNFLGYSSLVKKQLENDIVGEDTLKKYDDKYELYDEDEEKEVDLKELKKELKKNKLPWYKAILYSFKGGFHPIRLLGYSMLAMSFIYLDKNGVFNLPAFLFGITIIPAVSLVYLYSESKRQNSNGNDNGR